MLYQYSGPRIGLYYFRHDRDAVCIFSGLGMLLCTIGTSARNVQVKVGLPKTDVFRET